MLNDISLLLITLAMSCTIFQPSFERLWLKFQTPEALQLSWPRCAALVDICFGPWTIEKRIKVIYQRPWFSVDVLILCGGSD